MYNKFLTSTALVLFASSVSAADLGGKITTEIKENAEDKWGATTSFDLGIAPMGTAVPAFGAIDLDVNTDGDVTIDEWQVGTVVNGDAMLSFGDQGNVWLDKDSDAAHSTTADPAMDESVQVKVLGAQMGIGFKDIEADATEIGKVQGLYEMNLGMIHVGAAGSYDMDAEEYALGARSDLLLDDKWAAGAMVTYESAEETIAYELDAGAFGMSAYLNGDADELAQNVGGKYSMEWNGLDFEAGANYNLDSEDLSPMASVAFSF